VIVKAIWRREGRALVPASPEAEDMLRSMKPAAECFCHTHVPRNMRQHRLFWSLMGILVDYGVFATSSAAADATKVATGHVTTLIMPDTGQTVMTPKSISFASMPQMDFNDFFRGALRAVCDRWLPGLDDEALEARVFEIVDGRSGRPS
jgi:hypothetical protein